MENVIVKITCGNCKTSWHIDWLHIGSTNARICPCCGEAIDDELWQKEVVYTAASALDCNMELERYATGYHKTQFNVDFLHRKERG